MMKNMKALVTLRLAFEQAMQAAMAEDERMIDTQATRELMGIMDDAHDDAQFVYSAARWRVRRRDRKAAYEVEKNFKLDD